MSPADWIIEAELRCSQPISASVIERKAYGFVHQVYWEARISRVNEQVKNDQLDLTAQLTTVKDDVECPPGQRFCVFDVILVNDQVRLVQLPRLLALTTVIFPIVFYQSVFQCCSNLCEFISSRSVFRH